MTLDELSDMCSGESPGLDGIPPTILHSLLGQSGTLLFVMIQAAVERGYFFQRC